MTTVRDAPAGEVLEITDLAGIARPDPEALEYKSPDRDRTIRSLPRLHASTIMRGFVGAEETNACTNGYEFILPEFPERGFVRETRTCEERVTPFLPPGTHMNRNRSHGRDSLTCLCESCRETSDSETCPQAPKVWPGTGTPRIAPAPFSGAWPGRGWPVRPTRCPHTASKSSSSPAAAPIRSITRFVLPDDRKR